MISRTTCFIISAVIALFMSHGGMADQAGGRFIYEGDGVLSIRNIHTGHRVEAEYRDADGNYSALALAKINRVFGMTGGLQDGISLRLIAILDHLEDRFSPQGVLELYSGYRSPRYNEALRRRGKLAAQTSYHMDGMAADVIFPGAEAREVWEYARGLHYGGAGFYHGHSIHIDSGRPRFWTAETALPKGGEPPLNKNIYLTVDRDIYLEGEPMHLSFSGISDYPFGVQRIFSLVKGERVLLKFRPSFINQSEGSCVVIREREWARIIDWTIPQGVGAPKGALRVEVTFCAPVYERMPPVLQSREFKIVKKK